MISLEVQLQHDFSIVIGRQINNLSFYIITFLYIQRKEHFQRFKTLKVRLPLIHNLGYLTLVEIYIGTHFEEII